ncbi:MAG: lipase family protein [Micrococcales bacterium]|nr:lipase family protein [Micrococcales bacterium]
MTVRPLTLVTAAAASAALVLASTPAGADEHAIPGTAGATTVTDVAEPTRPAFYEPPASIPGTPGTVIRTEPATNLLDPLGLSAAFYDAKRVMYASRDREGRPIAVTGTVIVPRAPYVGLSSRPLVSYSVGTQGMADRCAPSRQMAEGFEYESLFFQNLLNRGYAVAMTDYQGLGTPGTHTYMNRQVQGQAVLDMARAAQRLGNGLTGTSPVGFMGYSQGGGGAASAAELAGAYAPELRVKGTVAGAVPADLGKVGESLEGGLWATFLDFATVGLAAGYHIDMDPILNDKGEAMARQVEGECVFDFAKHAFQKSAQLTEDGRSLTETMKSEPFASVIADNRIGNRKPTAPVLISHSMLDDTIPYGVGRQLAKDWCAKGVNVRFSPNVGPAHVGGMPPSATEALSFFEARFAGFPQVSNCWIL